MTKFIVIVTWVLLIIFINTWHSRFKKQEQLISHILTQVQLNNVAIDGINANLNNLDINYDVIVREKRD